MHIDVELDTLDAAVPNFVLQPLVENALRHGIGPKIGGGRVDVSARRERRLAVARGARQRRAACRRQLTRFNTGVGLTNTRSRLEHLYGDRYRFECQTPPGGGLAVTVVIPFTAESTGQSLAMAPRTRHGERGMNKIRALVVDDEPMARERVLSLLQQEEDVEVVGECGDGPQAVSAIQHQTPDLVFLDVQMPGLNGFEVINAIGAERMPTVIFVTAYDEYALRAFEVHALDYLLKPFGRDRFQRDAASTRASSLERRRAGDLGRRLLALVNDIKPEPRRSSIDWW